MQPDSFFGIHGEVLARQFFDRRPVLAKKYRCLDFVRRPDRNAASEPCAPADHLEMKSELGRILSRRERLLHMAHLDVPLMEDHCTLMILLFVGHDCGLGGGGIVP